MTIEYDQHDFRGRLPPLAPRPVPKISLESILAVGTVYLNANRVPTKELVAYFTALLGLEFVSTEDGRVVFRRELRQVVLIRGERPANLLPLPERYRQDAQWKVDVERFLQACEAAEPAEPVDPLVPIKPVPWRGHLLLAVVEFDSALDTLRREGIPCEVLQLDDGVTRYALFNDPAGNWIHLQELRRIF